MPLLYKIVRDNRVESDHLYYGRAVHINTVDTDALATIIQQNCSMKKSDVLAVLAELVEVMTMKLQDSCVVKLNGLGSFRLGMKTSGADKEEDFSVNKNVTGLRVKFLAQGKRSQSNNKITRAFLDGVKLQKFE